MANVDYDGKGVPEQAVKMVRLEATVKASPDPVNLEIGSYESVRFIESKPAVFVGSSAKAASPTTPSKDFDQDRWAVQLRYVIKQAHTEGVPYYIRWYSGTDYGHIPCAKAHSPTAGFHGRYFDAPVLVMVDPHGEVEVINNKRNIPREALGARPGWGGQQISPAKDIPPVSPPKVAKAPPPTTELWWQKEKREASEKLAAVVALRNDVRSLLGM